jgi:hypothetical protein
VNFSHQLLLLLLAAGSFFIFCILISKRDIIIPPSQACLAITDRSQSVYLVIGHVLDTGNPSGLCED